MTPTLDRALRPLKRRLQWRSSLKIFWGTLSAGLVLTCLFLGAGRLWPLLLQWQLLILGLLSTAILLFLGQFYAWFKPRTGAQLARQGDQYLKLDERLITAFELETGALETSPRLQEAQLGDALARLHKAPVSLLVPLFEPKSMAKSLGLVLALFLALELLYLWPNPQEAVVQQQVALENLIETEIEKLEEIQADLLEETADLTETNVEELTDDLQALIDNLEKAREAGSPEQALAALSETEESLKAIDETRLQQEQAFNSLADSLAESDFEGAREAAEALEEGALDQAAEALQQAGQNPPTSQAEANDLADALSQAASALAATNPDLAQSLQQAADALRSGDQQATQEALNQAAQQLAEAGEQMAGQQQVTEALENIRQAREALAQQGREGSGGDSGQAAQGSEQGEQGAGAAQGQSLGQGSGGSGRGDPDGDVAEGTEAEGGVPGPMSTDNGPNQNRLEDYNSVYAPQHLGGEGGPFVVPDQQGSDGSGVDIGQTLPNPNREAGDVTVPYTEVYGEYQDQASTALDNEHIPLGMRDYIRQYFGALEPGQ